MTLNVGRVWYCTGSDFHVKLVYCGISKNTYVGFCKQANEHTCCIGGSLLSNENFHTWLFASAYPMETRFASY